MLEKRDNFNESKKSSLELPRALGLVDIIGIVIGSIIGSGIFIVPATIAHEVKSPILLLSVWVVGGLLSFFGALSFAELGASYPHAGGIYVYLREAYGPLISFLFGWTLFLVIDSGAIATLSSAFATKYLPHFLYLSPVGKKIVALGFITFLTVVNYIGVRWGANLMNFLTAIKLGALISVSGIVLIFAKGNPSNFISPAPDSFSFGLIGSFGVALVASLWAYKGWEAATYSAGETKKPERNLPLGILIGVLICIFLYWIANIAYLYVYPTTFISKSDRIASDAMNVAIGPIGASIIAFIILFSITGAANGNVLTAPRVFFAMARDGLFFKKIADVHPRFLTPHISIVSIGIWSAILSLTGTFEQLFTYVIFGQWIFFGLTATAVIVLRIKKPELPRPYKTWGYPVTTIIFILSTLFISFNTLINEFWRSIAGLTIILLGIPAYLYWKSKTGEKSK